MKKTALNNPLNMTLVIALCLSTVGISACSSDKEQAGAESGKVMAVDRVDAATELARENAPKAEDIGFEETSAAAPTDTTAADADTTGDTKDTIATSEEAAGATATSSMSETPDGATTDATSTNDNPNADKTVADGLE